MWNELESYKNHFLQSQLKHLSAEPINQMVKKEFKLLQCTKGNAKCRFPCDTPCRPSTHFDDRSKLAYGLWALPKLMSELGSDNELVRWRAINSLSEFLVNPINAQSAITHTDLVRNAHNALWKFRKEASKEVSKLLQIFNLLSLYLNGALQIANRQRLLEQLYTIIMKRGESMDLAAKILCNLTEKTQVLLYMMEKTNGFGHLTTIFHNGNCTLHYPHALWMHLSHFLELAPEMAIGNGFFELFHQRMTNRVPAYNHLNMKCFALLLRCAEGQKRFDDIDGPHLLHRMLTTEGLDTYEFVALAFLQGLLSKRSLWRCREFIGLPDDLVRLAMVTPNSHLQLYCLQVLRHLAEMLCIKRFMKLNCLNDIKQMQCCNEANTCKRNELIRYLNREIYHSRDSNCGDFFFYF